MARRLDAQDKPFLDTSKLFLSQKVNLGTQTQCGFELLWEEMKLPVGSQLFKVPEGGTSGTDSDAAGDSFGGMC